MAKITLFSQIFQKLPKDEIKKTIREYGTDKHSKGFNKRSHFQKTNLNLALRASLLSNTCPFNATNNIPCHFTRLALIYCGHYCSHTENVRTHDKASRVPTET